MQTTAHNSPSKICSVNRVLQIIDDTEMKRNMSLIRKILLAVEANEQPDLIPDYSADEVLYNQALAVEAGLVEGRVSNNLSNTTQIPSAVHIKKLTWQGHEFIDLMKKAEVWETIQREFKEASFATILNVGRELAEGWAKKRVNEILKDDLYVLAQT